MDKIIDSFKVKDKLNPKYFTEKGKMDSKVRRSFLKVAKEFLDFVGLPLKIKDVTLTGSTAGYNYSDFSDADLHIIYDPKKVDMLPGVMKELFQAKQALFNKQYDPFIAGHEAEVYFQDINEPHASQSVYSVLNNDWIKKPKKKQGRIKSAEIKEKAEMYRKQVDNIEAKLADGQDVTDEIAFLKKKIKKTRQESLSGEGEYSVGNLAFKYLRRDGTLERLDQINKGNINKKLSLSEGMKHLLLK